VVSWAITDVMMRHFDQERGYDAGATPDKNRTRQIKAGAMSTKLSPSRAGGRVYRHTPPGDARAYRPVCETSSSGTPLIGWARHCTDDPGQGNCNNNCNKRGHENDHQAEYGQLRTGAPVVSRVRRQGLEPRTRGLRVRCSAN
jgi:hypothetical protein